MSLETLLQETIESFRESPISEQQIEAVLNPLIEGTEICERKVRKFKIRRLKVNGEIECDLLFKSGVNVIKADNLKGKTSVLNVIKLAITGKDKLDQKLKDKVKEILLEFQMDHKIYTSYMWRDEKKGSRHAWAIYDMSVDEIVLGESKPIISSKAEIIKFFMSQFGLPEITQRRRARRDRLGHGEKSIGFGDYFRAFYQDQERGYTEIMSDYPTTRVSVMGVMMGLHGVRLLSEVDRVIAGKEFEIKILEKKLQTLTAYMENRYENTEDFYARLDEKVKILSKKQEDLKDLDRQTEAFLKSNISPILEEIDSIESTIKTLENQQRDLQMIILDLKDDESQLLMDTVWMEEEKTSNRIFRPYFVRTCPRCESEIAVEKLRLEEETQNCALCGNKIKPDEERIVSMETEISERKKKLHEMRERINEYEKTLETLIGSLREKREARFQLYKNKEKLRKEGYERFLPRIADTYKEVGRIEAELSEFRSLGHTISKIQEEKSTYELGIEILKHFEKILKKHLLEKDLSKEDIKRYMESYMREFLEIVTEFDFESIELYFMEPEIDGMKFKELPAGAKVRASMALYYGLLMMGLKHNGRLPCFLIIDSPRQHEMQGDFLGIVQAYSKLDENNGKEVQVIIASADPSIKAATSDSSKIMEFEGWILGDKVFEGSENGFIEISNNSGMVRSENVSIIQTRLEDFNERER